MNASFYLPSGSIPDSCILQLISRSMSPVLPNICREVIAIVSTK
uniref:Uncharacterized protein n=1 Tax=Arundo donax TaxID=35708 RepID=A0A0A9BZ56_ARUDO